MVILHSGRPVPGTGERKVLCWTVAGRMLVRCGILSVLVLSTKRYYCCVDCWTDHKLLHVQLKIGKE